jgi:transposase
MKRTEQDRERLRARAIEMRQAGIGSRRIAQELGIGGALACELLRGVPVPGSLQRPQAKDELREAALLLRQQGRTYDEIQEELAVSKGSLSLWLRDIPHPTPAQRARLTTGHQLSLPLDEPAGDVEIARLLRVEGWLLREIAAALGVAEKTVCLWVRGLPVPPRAMHGKTPEQAREMNRRRWDKELARREQERQAVKDAAGARVGALSDRELELIAVTAYWCEGTKDKPYARREMVKFINSDPGIILLFLEYLRRKGFGWSSLHLYVSIHESADVQEAVGWWADLIDVTPDQLGKPTLKRHNPKTVRKNTGNEYVGCLTISVRGSRVLYQEIEGLWRGIAVGWSGTARS